MLEVTIDMTEFHPVDETPDGAVVDGTRQAMKDASGAGFYKSQELVPKDTSELMLSGVPPYENEDGSWVWAYDAPHALPVEYGSVPHWVPIDPLLGWARRVLGDESAAYAVRQNIAQYGTQPQPYVRPGYDLMMLKLEGTGIVGSIRDKIPGL